MAKTFTVRDNESKYPTTFSRLDEGRMKDSLVGWLVTIGITLLAFVLRLHKVSHPSYIIFDETYYAKDAWSILNYGYERQWPDGIDDILLPDNTMAMEEGASFIVHPPLGKQLIAIGEWAFGMNAFGWRIMAVIFGSLLIFMVIRLARRLSRSTLIGGLAGLLLCFDGLSFVMSRIALLDIFQAFFLVAAVSAVAADRDYFRHKLADYLVDQGTPNLGGKFGPWILWRPWRLIAGLMFGCALAVKWNSIYVLAVMGLWSVASDWGIRKLAGASKASLRSILKDGIPAFCYLVVAAIPVYLVTWIPWLRSYRSQQFNWTPEPKPTFVRWFGEPFAGLIDYHRQMYEFHTGDFMMKEVTHTYQAHPAGWLLNARPIGIDAQNGILPGVDGCAVPEGETCLRVISGTGTPFLWWFALLALLAGLVFWLAGKDWRFGLPILAMAGTYLPWFMYAERPLFFFYAITIIPFTTIVLALCLGKILGPAEQTKRRKWGTIIVAAVVVIVILNFWFIYPILTDQLMPRSRWLWRMWFPSWI